MKKYEVNFRGFLRRRRFTETQSYWPT